jgi:hypothetical protein
MRCIKRIAADLPGLEEYLSTLSGDFDRSGELIHSGRNEIRVVDINGFRLVVKYFKRITFFNRVIFATVRSSKAERAYEHSLKLKEFGISTPEPVAFCDFIKNGILEKSFYICRYTDYRPLKEEFFHPVSECETILEEFARFSYRLHTLGIYHDDFNLDNILYYYNGSHFDFSLIDNNRMRFRPYNVKRGIKNMRRLGLPVDKLGVICAEYSRIANTSDLRTMNFMIFCRLEFLIKGYFRRYMKKFLHILAGDNKSAVHHLSKPTE